MKQRLLSTPSYQIVMSLGYVSEDIVDTECVEDMFKVKGKNRKTSKGKVISNLVDIFTNLPFKSNCNLFLSHIYSML